MTPIIKNFLRSSISINQEKRKSTREETRKLHDINDKLITNIILKLITDSFTHTRIHTHAVLYNISFRFNTCKRKMKKEYLRRY